MKQFDSEAFKAGQKALTRNGNVAKFIGLYEDCAGKSRLLVSVNGYTPLFIYRENNHYTIDEHDLDLMSMVSRHQHLIYNYDPEDTWQYTRTEFINWATIEVGSPNWDEACEYRIHPHNDLIKAHKKGAKIEAYIVGDWVEEPKPDWYEDTKYRIKPEEPVYKKAKLTGTVVKFTSLTEGVVIEKGNDGHINVGDRNNCWIEHTDIGVWKDWTPPEQKQIHCLAYDAKLFSHEQTTEVRARVVKKEFAEANDWKIIQEWEV